MKTYHGLNLDVNTDGCRRVAFELTYAQMAMMLDKSNLSIFDVRSNPLKQTIEIYLSGESANVSWIDKVKDGDESYLFKINDLSLLEFLENAAAELRQKLTPTE